MTRLRQLRTELRRRSRSARTLLAMRRDLDRRSMRISAT